MGRDVCAVQFLTLNNATGKMSCFIYVSRRGHSLAHYNSSVKSGDLKVSPIYSQWVKVSNLILRCLWSGKCSPATLLSTWIEIFLLRMLLTLLKLYWVSDCDWWIQESNIINKLLVMLLINQIIKNTTKLYVHFILLFFVWLKLIYFKW